MPGQGKKMERPRIAIPVLDRDVENYSDAVSAAGMVPVIITEPETEGFDGLLLPGGVDIDPARYGERMNGSRGIDRALDELQFAVLDEFVLKRKPVLGICRGHQLINVYFGGTLIQDIPTAGSHTSVRPGCDRVHLCAAEPGSWIEDLYGNCFASNSAHHQACGRMGKELILDACCNADGVAEALHHTGLPVFGVQFHPERMCLKHEREDAVNGLPVFSFFRGICLGN